MAKATIKRTCGHLSEVQLYGLSTERQRKMAWLRSTPCLKCERKAGNEQAAEVNAGMVALTGSEKQIKWAKSIRREAMDKIAKLRADFAAAGQKASVSADVVAAEMSKFDAAQDKVAAQASAAWWIDRRNKGARDLLAEIA